MYVVTLDVGTGGFHVAIYAVSGSLLAADYKAIGYESQERGETLSFDPERFFAAAMKLMNATMARAGLDSRRPITIAVTGQRHGCVFHDAQMQPVLAVANLDGRVDRETLDRYASHRSEIYRISRRIPSEIFPALRLAWMREHDPRVFYRIVGFLMINEWFAYRLSGVPCSEITSITESLLFDVAGGERSDRLGELFGQQGIRTWPVVTPGTIIGTVREDVSKIYGLPAGANVSIGAGDTQCAAIGSGALVPGDVVAVNGSTTPVVMVTDSLISDPEQRVWADRYVDDRYLIESNGGKTGMLYRDITDVLSCKDLPEPDAESIYEAERCEVYATLVPDPQETIDFLGRRNELRFRTDPARVLRLLPYLMIENTAFAIVAHTEELQRVRGTPARRVYLTGGSSRSPLTQRIVSILLEDYPLYLTSIYDTTSRGAAMLAIAGSDRSALLGGVFTNADDAAPIELRPDSEARGIADAVVRRYRQWSESFARLTASGSGAERSATDG